MEPRQVKYHADTPAEVKAILETYRRGRSTTRLILYYGDTETGRSWGDTDTGRIGTSTGREPIPLSIHNSRAIGGSGILDHCIIRIDTAQGKRTLYRNPKASNARPVTCPKCRRQHQIDNTCRACNNPLEREK